MAEQTGADSAAAAEQLALLLSSANLGSEGGTNGAWLTQTDILTTDNLDFEGVFNGGGGRQGKVGSSQQQREADPFLDSAQDLESVYSSHMSSAQDIMSSMHSQDPNLFLSTDPNSINAAGGNGDGQCDPTPRSLSASLAHDAVGEAGTSTGASYRSGAPNLRDGAQASPRKAPQRGQGYRRLWQQVTKVSKGQKLQDNLGLAFSDMTVEDLLKIVLKLAPQESAVEAIKQGLFYLDSSAMAALLKELAKQGYLKRAVEIFDWLRSLEPGHELSSLCDLYTYTTMISQCGSHQQLRRALELVAEMRSRGIDCNVHTYSALMNVCIKANELDLAQDVYKQMLEEGCSPNLVTYNILIDVYVKRCQWEEAVKVLDTLEKQGIQAEVRTYNTVISACNKSGQPEQALKVYEKMLAAGVKPSATTYTALISAYGKKGQVEKALEIFRDMIRRGCERNVITYSSLISACEKAGRWEMALELFSKMHKENCKPNVVTFNSLIAACSHGGHWEKASELFEQMQTQGCKPDSITYCGLITAYERGGQWRRALKAFEQMQAQGCHPDAAVFNSLMEVLWQSGVLLAQAKALQLWTLANRSGHFRIYTNSKQDSNVLQYSTVAFTSGAAVVTVVRWVSELKNKLLKDGAAFFRDKVVFTLHKSKQNRSEQPSARIFEAVSMLLAGNASPFAMHLFDQTITLEAASPQLTGWLRSAAFNDFVHIQQSQQLKRISLDLLLSEDVAIAARCIEAFNAVKRYEQLFSINPALCNQALLAQRPQIVALALKYGAAFGLKDDTIYDALQLFDRVSCSGAPINVAAWPLMLCSCLLLAARQVEAPAMWPPLEQVTLLTGFGADVMVAMERNVLMWLGHDISTISPMRVIQLYLERLGHYLPDFKAIDRITKDLQTLVLKVACSPVVGLRPSLVGAAALVVVRRARGMVPAWPSVLQTMTDYAPNDGELAACVMHMEALMQQ
ncbi:hypothetical protein HXX76_008673 [Chlamydomonas incerta]|uniref:Uncharacterized protein n=1 Tax=Chlamydomonas incerta TaxID=51695 RepID=A0A835T5P4_CHLIN|nr:hypothetical protein HXX76_008673 [Chlamydomonas incerta]|eukprot:KAG2432945.1 hypothetical protein HXX76_008673 [Chlamydomonas incerta]